MPRYNRLNYMSKNVVDRVAGGSLYNKTADEAYELIETMAYDYQFLKEYSIPKRAVRVYEADAVSALSVQVATLSSQLDNWRANTIHIPYQECELCGEDHMRANCRFESSVTSYTSEQTNYISNFQQQYNLYTDTYNLRWQNHYNVSCDNQNSMNLLPEFQQ
ncbi:hypothetical protein TorRG33x02_183840 [Trema orientale]|uniref:Uncharacterized protein n=1 Tax=Trema orientale TaxID=63057 RepID=A0A2P5EJS6_TREOI|nr:hypothetical protein TorRG33x02_183840 [Trema orientale]